VARHLPQHRREDAAPPCRAGRAASRNFTILDTDDQLRLLKQLIQAEGLDEKRWPARQLAGLIDQWKNKGLTPADVGAAEGERFANGRGQKLYRSIRRGCAP
jgi:superfamily I DNA/RNA helicase